MGNADGGERPSSVRMEVSQQIHAPIERVYHAWLDQEKMGCWLFATPGGIMHHVEVDPRVGGEFLVVEQRGVIRAEHFGTYLKLDPPHRIEFAFTTDRLQAPTPVTVELTSHGSDTELTLSHEVASEWAAYVDRIRASWKMIIENLARMLRE